MGKKLVRQFKSHNAPAGARGYRPQVVAVNPLVNPPVVNPPVVNYGVPVIDHGVRQRPPAPPTPPVVDLSMIPEIPMLVPYPPTAAQIPRTMGTPALPPDWYPETPNRIWSPQRQPTTDPRLRRNTGEGDLPINVPRVNLPTTTLPPQRPTSPYGQPNVPVDITPEQFTLPPQQQRLIHERPTTIDYGPITTPIERPIQEEAGNIEPQQSYPITPGPQITATEQSFYEPQTTESAYAYPIQADYPQTQPQPLPPDLNQDEITNLIDTLIPEQQEAKTINFPQEGPQWIEDPYTLAAQEAIDQAGFIQDDPSLINLGMPPIIDQAPELAYTQPQPEDPYVIDYSNTYGEPTLPRQEFPQIFTPEPIIQQLPITQPPELGMPEIPVAPILGDDPISAADIRAGLGTTGEIPLPIGESIGITPETIQPPIGANPMVEATITSNPDLVVPVAADTSTTGGTVAGMKNLPPAGGPNDLIFMDQEGDMVIDIENFESGGHGWVRPGLRDIPEDTTVIADDTPTVVTPTVETVENLETVIPAKTITPEGIVIDDSDETYTVDTTAGVDIEQLPEAPSAGEVAEGQLIDPPLKDFTPEIAGPLDPVIVEGGVDVEVDQGGKVDPNVQQKALTTTGQGGRRWLHTGPQDFADALHRFRINRGTTQGPPIVTDTPAVSGPVVNRETGEITEKPLTWYQFEPAGSSVSPYGATTIGGTTDTTGTSATLRGGSPFLGEPDIKHYTDSNVFDVIGSNLYPEVKIAADGQRYFESEADLVNWSGGFMEETGIDAKPYFYDKVVDGIKKTGNYLLDGSQKFLNILQGFADFVGDPSKAKGEDATLETLQDSYNGFKRELTEFWDTNPDSPWGRNMFKPGETQKYGSLQPYAILAALSNPPAAMAIAAKTLIKDIMWSAKNMFAEEANYDGNYVQDMVNGAFHLVGRGIKSFGKNFSGLLKGDKAGAKVEKGETVEGKTTEDSRWLENLQKNLDKTSDDKLRDSWLTHAAFDSSTHKLTKAFIAEGIPVVLTNNRHKFIKAINDRKMTDFFDLMDTFGVGVSVFDQLAGAAGLDPKNPAEANMIDILREWERQRRANK